MALKDNDEEVCGVRVGLVLSDPCSSDRFRMSDVSYPAVRVPHAGAASLALMNTRMIE